MKEHEAAACDAVKSKPLTKTKPDQQVQQQQRRASANSSSSWRRRSFSDAGQPVGQDGELFQQRRRHLGRCIAGLALAVVLGVLCLRQAPSSKQDDGTSLSSTGAAGSYLRQIAALHDWESTASGVAQLQQDVQGLLAACAKQVILPEVKVPQHIPHPAWFPPTGSLLPETAALDLNCSLPAHAAACAQAAASNSYEGASIALTVKEVAALLEASSAFAANPHSAAPAADTSLAGLDLGCSAQPAACASVSASTNAYEDTASWAGDTSAEATAYLTAAAVLASHGGWDALVGGSDWQQELRQPTEKERESVLGLTNGYEGVRALSRQYKRQAEEAAAHYLDVSVLDLDCSPAAVLQDPHTLQECMRSKAVNRYESRPAQPTGAAWADKQQPPAGPEAVQDAAAEEPQQAASRVVSTASFGHHRTETAAARRRQYFKNPCNSPDARRQYKNPRNQQPQRLYYKNPANAPASFETLLPQAAKAPQTPAGPAAQSSLLFSHLRSAGLWVTLTALLVTCLLLEGVLASCTSRVCSYFEAVRTWCSRKLRRTQVPRSHSMLLVPCTSQELPAPQLMQAHLALQPQLPELDAQHSTCPPPPTAVALTQSSCDAGSPPSLAESPEVEAVTAPAQAQADSPTVLLPTGPPFSAAAYNSSTLSELLICGSDDIQAGIDSPRSRAAQRRSMTPLPSRSHAGTPGPCKAV